MSNPEQLPSEVICDSSPGERGVACPVQILEPRDVPLGGLRAMDVRRTLPQRARSLIGAWCFLDHYGPDDVALTGGMNVPAHPHIGLQTVSWLFSGEIEHRDSAGFHAMVRPGELNLMTAGRGISHSERSTPSTTVLHGAQLWIALPSGARDGGKDFEHYAPPLIDGGGDSGWQAQVFLGSLLGERSPVRTCTALLGAEIRLEPGAVLEFEVDPAFEHGLLVDSGAASLSVRPVDGSANFDEDAPVAKNHLAYAPLGAAALRISSTGAEPARLLLLGGEPLGEQIVMWWNFIGRDHDEIVRARTDWQAQISQLGVADPAGDRDGRAADGGTGNGPGTGKADPARFGLPQDEPEPPLPAPPLPIARLVPRRQ
ncbi:MAG: pirin family protein [Actinobacteria bacterium]|nr:pirin family protein [Actinomycetota bacterium]